MRKDPQFDRITWTIIKCAMKVHSALGPGLFESTYLACLVLELKEAGFRVETKVRLPLVYRGLSLDCGYEIDILVDGLVIVELKTVAALLPVHHAQLLTYLKLADKPVGLLINFHVAHLKDGIVRKVNTPKHNPEDVVGLA